MDYFITLKLRGGHIILGQVGGHLILWGTMNPSTTRPPGHQVLGPPVRGTGSPRTRCPGGRVVRGTRSPMTTSVVNIASASEPAVSLVKNALLIARRC